MEASLKVIGGPGHGAHFALNPGNYTLGRDADNPIQLDSQAVSRRHAELRVTTDQVVIRDLGSANGTIVNHRKIQETSLRNGDKIYIGDFILELSAEPGMISEKRRSETIVGEAFAPPSGTHQPRFVAAMGPLADVDWKLKLLFLLALTLLVDHLFVTKLFSNRITEDVTQISLKRARDIARYLAEKNKQDLAQGNETLLDVESVMSDEGVLAAYVANEHGRILAPTYKLNQQLNDETSRAALALKRNDVVVSDRLAGGIYSFAAPIRIYRDKEGDYRTIGVAVIAFSPKSITTTLEATKRLWLIAISFVPLVCLILFFMIRQITLPPIMQLADSIGSLFRGEIERIDRKSSLSALRPLIDALNAAAVRLQQEPGSLTPAPRQLIDDKDFLDDNTQLRWLLTTLSDAVVVVSPDGIILALNQKARTLLEINSPNTRGMTLEEAITNQYYRNFLMGCLKEFRGMGKANLTKMLEYGDFAYQFTLHGWNKPSGELQYVTMIVEKL